MKFKIGDKVRIVKNVWFGGECEDPMGIGEVHTIINCNKLDNYPYTLDAYIGYTWCDDELELVEEKKVFTKSDLKTGMFGVMTWFDGNVKDYFVIVEDKIIYQDGGYDTLEELDADLEFDEWYIDKLYTGICSFGNLNSNVRGYSTNCTLVYDRERDTKPLYNGKVVCVDLCGHNSTLYTVGKIYQFVDGKFITEDGNKIPFNEKIYSFEDWERYTASKFIEVVE